MGDVQLDVAHLEVVFEIVNGRILGFEEDVDHGVLGDFVDVDVLVDTSAQFVALEVFRKVKLVDVLVEVLVFDQLVFLNSETDTSCVSLFATMSSSPLKTPEKMKRMFFVEIRMTS